MNVRPKKSLGQHFLISPAIAQKITNLLQPDPENVIIEIGPGKGILTQYLIQNPNPIYALDIDNESIEYLKNHLQAKNLHIQHQDILEYDFPHTSISFIGNLPYNISSPIFFKVLEHHPKIREAVVMVQKEVAIRITSKPNSKEYGILSVLLGHFYEMEYCFQVKPTAFFPPPKVDSAVVRMKHKKSVQEIDFQMFKTIVKVAFQQRRKMLSNALKSLNLNVPKEFLNKRAEQLSVADFISICNLNSTE